MLWSRRPFTAHTPATVSGYGIEPDGESLRVLNLGQMPQRSGEDLLHGIFRVFRMPADLHAEGIDRALQQTDCLFDRFRSIAAQEIGSLNEFGSHRLGLSQTRPVYSPATRDKGIHRGLIFQQSGQPAARQV